MNYSVKKTKWASLYVMAILFLTGISGQAVAGSAQLASVDMDRLIQDLQKGSSDPNEMTLVWWIPEEFWAVSFAQDPSISADQAEEFMKIVRPYTLVVVVDGRMGAMAGVTYRTEGDIRGSTRIKDRDGNSYRPLSDDNISADCQNFLLMMKPIFANMLGPMGENMHFILFPAQDDRGRKLADAQQEGAFAISLGAGRDFNWKLPVGSLLQAKICPTCGDKLSGAYRFCPWDGARLP